MAPNPVEQAQNLSNKISAAQLGNTPGGTFISYTELNDIWKEAQKDGLYDVEAVLIQGIQKSMLKSQDRIFG